MFGKWDFERVLLALLGVIILAGLGVMIWQRSVAEELRSQLGSSEKQLTQIGELADEIITLQEEIKSDTIASGKAGPFAYIEEQEVQSRIGKKFTITNTTELHTSDGYEDTRFVLAPALPDNDFSRKEIANFLLHVEGNTTRMKATRIKLDLSTRKNADPDSWKPTFTLTDRKPIIQP